MKKFLCVFVALAGPVFAETDYVSSKTVRDIQLGQPNNNAIQNLYVAKDARVVGNLTAKAATSTNHVPTWKQVTDYATTNAPNNIASNWSYHGARSNVVLGANWLSGDGGNEGVAVRADGNVGVGTTNPAAKLDVNGIISASNIVIGASSGTADLEVVADGNADNLVDVTFGRSTAKSVAVNARSDSASYVAAFNLYDGASTNVGRFYRERGSALFPPAKRNDIVVMSIASATNYLHLGANSTIVETITPTGVGIGTNLPATTLDVNGDAMIRGPLTASNSVIVFGNLPTSTNGRTTKGTLWVSNGVLGIVGY